MGDDHFTPKVTARESLKVSGTCQRCGMCGDPDCDFCGKRNGCVGGLDCMHPGVYPVDLAAEWGVGPGPPMQELKFTMPKIKTSKFIPPDSIVFLNRRK